MIKAHDVSQFTEGAIWCRSFGHSWKPYTAPNVTTKTYKGFNVTLVCASCETFKHFMLSVRGEYGPASYTYPDRYLADFIVTPSDRQALKLEALSEILPPKDGSHKSGTVTAINSKKKAVNR
jgi:hypothetical protein